MSNSPQRSQSRSCRSNTHNIACDKWPGGSETFLVEYNLIKVLYKSWEENCYDIVTAEMKTAPKPVTSSPYFLE